MTSHNISRVTSLFTFTNASGGMSGSGFLDPVFFYGTTAATGFGCAGAAFGGGCICLPSSTPAAGTGSAIGAWSPICSGWPFTGCPSSFSTVGSGSTGPGWSGSKTDMSTGDFFPRNWSYNL